MWNEAVEQAKCGFCIHTIDSCSSSSHVSVVRFGNALNQSSARTYFLVFSFFSRALACCSLMMVALTCGGFMCTFNFPPTRRRTVAANLVWVFSTCGGCFSMMKVLWRQEEDTDWQNKALLIRCQVSSIVAEKLGPQAFLHIISSSIFIHASLTVEMKICLNNVFKQPLDCRWPLEHLQSKVMLVCILPELA